MKEFIDVVFILDESGSMHDLQNDVIGGYNSLLNETKKLNEEVRVTTITFNHNVKVVHDKVLINEVKEFTSEDYRPGGWTALLDAIGFTIDRLDEDYKKVKPIKTIFYINTDGMENSSQNYSYPLINRMIEWHKEKENFEFNFVAANIDVNKEAERLGIDKNRAFEFEPTPEGAGKMMETMTCSICGSINEIKKNRGQKASSRKKK